MLQPDPHITLALSQFFQNDCPRYQQAPN